MRLLPTFAPRARAAAGIAVLAIAVMALVACNDDGDDGIGIAATTPSMAATEPLAPEPPTATATSTPTATPTPAPLPARCQGGDDEAMLASFEQLEADIEAAMAGYNGEWGVGIIDLDCEVEFAVRPDYVQYTASAGKIVPFIAALRAVEAGELSMEVLEPQLLPAMEHSLDVNANAINAMVTPAQVQEVLAIAGVSEATDFEYDWRQAFMPALDLARVWAALLEGELLGEEMTAYLLDLAAHPVIPEGLETFPLDSGLDGYQVGQKAGYYVYDGIPYYLLGAGFLRPVEAVGGTDADDRGADDRDDRERESRPADELRGVALVFQIRSLNPNLSDPQRRTVYPLLARYVEGGYADGQDLGAPSEPRDGEQDEGASTPGPEGTAGGSESTATATPEASDTPAPDGTTVNGP